MLSGIKFVPRQNLIDEEKQHMGSESSEDEHLKEKRRSNDSGVRRKERKRDKSKHRRSRKSNSLSDSEDEKRIKRSKKGKKRLLVDEDDDYSSDASSLDDSREEKHENRKSKKLNCQEDKQKLEKFSVEDDLHQSEQDVTRKEMGLDWMLRSESKIKQESSMQVEEKKQLEEIPRANPRELNPYLKDNGSGYPDDASISEAGDRLLSSSVIGDGGASWRLKALKRAKEQAAREGRNLKEVVEERWGSIGQLAESVTASEVAPARAHLHAIKDRKRGQTQLHENVASDEAGSGIKERFSGSRDYLHDVSSRNPEMRKPRQANLSWKRNRGSKISEEDKSLISGAISDINQFANDGNFMSRFMSNDADKSSSSHGVNRTRDDASPTRDDQIGAGQCSPNVTGIGGVSSVDKQALTANQLAAKVLQLRMKGKHDEADKLSKEVEAMVGKQDTVTQLVTPESIARSNRHTRKQRTFEEKRKEDDADFHLAKTIMQNKQFSLSGREEDEYGYEVAPSKKTKQRKNVEEKSFSKRLLTQQERCQFCFENPARPKHLVVSIANFTYLMLPQWQPIVEGHCYILPMQHEAATRAVDKNVWEEMRNFKKCLIKMFSREDKDVVFLETVVGLSKQRRHCLLECIPLPSKLAKQAPLYFKKAIDEAEEEWGQHDSKKVIPTSGNLQQVIPENFSYFHVEFGLDRGFVHVIDNDSNFSSGFGLNVIGGMLRLPEEDMFRRRRQEPLEMQKQAVARFAKEWDPFDWTKQLD